MKAICSELMELLPPASTTLTKNDPALGIIAGFIGTVVQNPCKCFLVTTLVDQGDTQQYLSMTWILLMTLLESSMANAQAQPSITAATASASFPRPSK